MNKAFRLIKEQLIDVLIGGYELCFCSEIKAKMYFAGRLRTKASYGGVPCLMGRKRN